jgi:hypothetical protein
VTSRPHPTVPRHKANAMRHPLWKPGAQPPHGYLHPRILSFSYHSACFRFLHPPSLHGATHRYGEAQDSRTAKGSAIPNAGLWNAEAELEKLGYEKRTFECPRCHRVESIVAEIKRGRLALQGTRSQAIPLAGLCFTNIQCIFAPSTTGSVCRPSFIHKVAMTVAFSKLRVALCNQRTV